MMHTDKGASSTRMSSCLQTGGGSQPDLAKLNVDAFDLNNITQRKRKQPDCECKYEMHELRKEMSSISALLQKFIDCHEQNISDIKSQIEEIKTSTTNISLEQNQISSKLSELESKILSNEETIKTQESDIFHLKNLTPTTASSSTNLYNNEKIIRELQERNLREKNIIIVGLPEQTSADWYKRQSLDESAVKNFLTNINSEYPKLITKIFRIGKFIPNKNRRLKVCFNSRDTAIAILQNKNKIPSKDIKVFSDQTPAQQKFLSELREELERRKQKGEENLIIKYYRGMPKIISTSKNPQ